MEVKYRTERKTKAEITKRDEDIINDYNALTPEGEKKYKVDDIADKYNMTKQNLYRILKKY
jgi:Mor family transcriptional regulator